MLISIFEIILQPPSLIYYFSISRALRMMIQAKKKTKFRIKIFPKVCFTRENLGKAKILYVRSMYLYYYLHKSLRHTFYFPDTPDMKNIIDGSIYSNTEYLSSTESSSSQTPSTSTSSLQTETSSPNPATTEFKVRKKLSLARPFQKKHANIEPTSKQSPQRTSTALKADFDEITREVPAQQQPPIRKFFKSKNKLEDSLVRSEHNVLDPNSSPTGTPPKKLKQEQ